MEENPVFVVVEVLSVEDRQGLQTYAERASALIGSFGGAVVAQGATPVGEEPGFGRLIIQRWTSESAFRTWIGSEAYKPLAEIRAASATMRAAIVPILSAPGT